MVEEPQPPKGLLLGRRAVEGIQGVTILHDFRWFDSINSWGLHCKFSLSIAHESPIPAETEWYITVGANYPAGPIHVYPAKVGGITHTFHHQHYNGNDIESLPWRSGDICAEYPLRQLERNPWYSSILKPEIKLASYINRAIEWLVAASTDDLVRNGEPYELPDFNTDNRVIFAFAEDADTFAIWRNFHDFAGTVAISQFKSSVYYVIRFDGMTTRKFIFNKWGNGLEGINKGDEIGIWVRLSRTPVLPPWQAPTNLGELRKVCQSQGINLDEVFKKTIPKLRDGKTHLLLVGFPIPVTQGEAISLMHWQALRLPILSSGKTTKKGFRPNESGYRQRDMSDVLRDDLSLDWIQSENWDSEQISTRGRLSSPLIDKHILLIGAGALGSSLAEILVREGIKELTIIDADLLKAGNLTRHTLTLSDINTNKAQSLAMRLNLTLPQSKVRAMPVKFPSNDTHFQEIIQDTGTIIDSTGSDEVLYELERYAWGGQKNIYTLSLGFGAHRLYCFQTRHESFSTNVFSELMRPWLTLERQENRGFLMPMEGIGCWHPVFPARIDDIWMLASAGIKWIESSITQNSPENPEFVVFEQIWKDGHFYGLRMQNDIFGNGKRA
jgi:hypothetical protein